MSSRVGVAGGVVAAVLVALPATATARPATEDLTGPVPMPHVQPQGLPPVPLPHVQRPGLPPVPMPHLLPDEMTGELRDGPPPPGLLLPPRRR